MKTWRPLVVAAVGVAVLVGVIWYAARSREPMYQGRTLSTWLDVYSTPPVSGPADESIPTSADAATAIRLIGTNGLPCLLEWIGTQESPARRRVVSCVYQAQWIEKLISRFALRKRYEKWAYQSTTLPKKAFLGFRILAQEAQPAVPQLVRLIGTSTNPHGRRAVVWSLGAIQPAAQQALPALIEYLKDPDKGVREAALQAVYGISFETVPAAESSRETSRHRPGLRCRPECSRVMVPTLAKLLADPKTDALRVIRLLSDIGPDAKTALPAIIPFQGSTNADIRTAANNARERIGTGP